jgi:uncharacterized membrane protein YdcZ (DUF606 family)
MSKKMLEKHTLFLFGAVVAMALNCFWFLSPNAEFLFSPKVTFFFSVTGGFLGGYFIALYNTAKSKSK